MKGIAVIALSLCVLVGSPAAPAAPSPESPAEAVGGANYFFCAAFQTLKVGGLITGRPDVALVGAIGGGVACGFGW